MIPAPFWNQAGAAAAPYVFVNYEHILAIGSGTTQSTISQIFTAGNNSFVHVRWESANTVTSVTDLAGNTYTPLTRLQGTGPIVSQWFYCLNVLGLAANTVTVTWNGANSFRWTSVLQFSGGTRAFDLEQATGTSAGATTVTSGSFTTSAAGLLLAGRGAYNSQTTTSFNQGITWVFPPGDSTSNYSSVGYRITTGALGPITVTETGPTNTNRALAIACFK